MIAEIHAVSLGGFTPFPSTLDTSFPSRMKKVESPATLEEKTHSPDLQKVSSMG